jgi:predicted O-linked N-acetylglucosamine transferase (SPINDLY family)
MKNLKNIAKPNNGTLGSTEKSSRELNEVMIKAHSFHQKGYLNEAQEFCQQVLNVKPMHFDALQLAGLIAGKTKSFEQAIDLFSRATTVNSNHALSFFSLGLAQQALNQHESAIASYRRAVSLKYDGANIYFNLGTAHEALNQLEIAITCYDQVIKLQPTFAGAYYNRGNALRQLSRFEPAIASYDKVISLNPAFADAHSNRGDALQSIQQFQAAVDSYDQAIKINPGHAQAYANRGRAFRALKRDVDALMSFDCAFQLNPEIRYLIGDSLNTKMQFCDWEDFDQYINHIKKNSKERTSVATSFVLFSLIDDPQLHRISTETFVKEKGDIGSKLVKIEKYSKHNKIRIGYFSADFGEHPVAYLTTKLFELHDRDKFETIAFSFGQPRKDDFKSRIEKAFDEFIDVSQKTDEEIELIAREMEIDIAIDLGGYTAGCRMEIFAKKVAPIQVNYLGFPGTMGADFIDYIIADKTVIPQDKQCYYAEKVVYLPETFMVNDSSYKPSEKIYSREQFGLPKNVFVYACFNASFKITPTTFAGWMRILARVDSSVLWIASMNEVAMKNLKMQASKYGISSDRIIFASKMPLVDDHLNRIRLADLFLDTFPYNAHTTANDALRVGLPVLTLIGESFASRVAASLLNALELPELITTNQEAYESLAVELAIDACRHRDIKSKLLQNLPSSLLLNTTRFTQNLERAYQEMYQRYQEDLAPENIII